MDNINLRISEIIADAGIRRIEFAKRIGISSASVTTMCSGKTKPSNQSIVAICREFGVNEEWLRTGAGEKYEEESVADRLASFCGSVLKLSEDDPKRIVIQMLADLPERDWFAIADIIEILQKNKGHGG